MEIAPTITRELIREVNNLMAYEFENMTEYGQRTLLKLWNEIEKEVEKCKRVYFQNIKPNNEVKN
jgi:hypothetical protein